MPMNSLFGCRLFAVILVSTRMAFLASAARMLLVLSGARLLAVLSTVPTVSLVRVRETGRRFSWRQQGKSGQVTETYEA